jgi:hypothetical protein
VVAPCLFGGRCPALARERDWCHENRSLRGDEADETLKFAYLVLRRHGVWPHDQRHFRVVSEKMAEKGREKLWGCGPRGRFLITRLSRHRARANAAWDEIARGDVVRFDSLEERTSELRVGADCGVSIVRKVVR